MEKSVRVETSAMDRIELNKMQQNKPLWIFAEVMHASHSVMYSRKQQNLTIND